MRLCRQVFAVAIIFLATPSVAEPSDGGRLPLSDRTPDRPVILASNEPRREEPDIDMFALMSGKCSTLKVAERDFKCRAVAYFHTQHGRANFTVVLDDPTDHSHIISFSGENARRDQDNVYELQIDQMLLNSKDRPKVDGLPVPFAELSAGNVQADWESSRRDGFPVSPVPRWTGMAKGMNCGSNPTARRLHCARIRQAPLAEEKRRAKQMAQFECRSKADVAKILPRDLTAYIIQCLGQNTPGADEPQ